MTSKPYHKPQNKPLIRPPVKQVIPARRVAKSPAKPAQTRHERIQQHLTLSILDANTHLIHVALVLSFDQPTTVTLALPRWIPGSYLLRDFAKHLQNLSAIDNDGNPIPLYRTSVSTWSLTARAGSVRVSYQVYAFDQSVRSCYVNARYAFINPASMALYVEEWRDIPYHFSMAQPLAIPNSQQDNWQVFTTLTPKAVNTLGFGHYSANAYDDLIEHPLLMGQGVVMTWLSAGIEHQMVLIDEAPLEHIDTDKIASDLQAICQQQQDFWGGSAPYSRYLFQVMVTTDGYGGLEHANSTALLTSRDSLAYLGRPNHKQYEDFLGLCSHEYFHAWMVKRIRPQALIRPNLQEAVITRLLWIFEGFTSLYDDWFLFRSGRIGSHRLLERWGETLSRALLTQGIAVQSVADASREAWIKYYQQTENSINTQVSYYTHGATLALTLLCELVARGKHLDLLLTHWWQAWQASPQQGMKEDQLDADLTALSAGNWTTWIERLVDRPYPDLNHYLSAQLPTLGLCLTPELAPQAGWKLKQEHGKLIVKQVLRNSPAQTAGIQVGDELIALNQWRCHRLERVEEMLTQLAQHHPQTIICLVARKDYLVELSLALTITVIAYKLNFDAQEQPNLHWLMGQSSALETSAQPIAPLPPTTTHSATVASKAVSSENTTKTPSVIKTRSQRLREKRRILIQESNSEELSAD